MKTIKEAAKEYAYRTDKALAEFVSEDFIAGVEFAQRWISVEEELPPCSGEDILIKGIDRRGYEGIIDTGYMRGKTPEVENFVSNACVLIKVTHWRKIELK
jgi:hypothetical protein